MTAYEEMARRVVQDGLRACTEKMLSDYVNEANFDSEDEYGTFIDSFTNAIMLGLKELLKPDKIKVYDPEKVAEGLG